MYQLLLNWCFCAFVYSRIGTNRIQNSNSISLKFLCRKLIFLRHLLRSNIKCKHSSTFFHWDDSELIFFIDPDKETFGFVMEDTSTLRPISFHTSRNQILITRYKQEMIINQLLAISFFHTQKWEVLASQIIRQLFESILHEILNLQSLFFGDSRRQSKTVDASANTDTSRLDWCIGVDIALDLGSVHVWSMFKFFIQTMVLTNDGSKDIGEINIGIRISSINATMLIVKFNSASNSLKFEKKLHNMLGTCKCLLK